MKLNDLVSIQRGASAIVLETGLNDKGLAASFVPTHSAIEVLKHIERAVQFDAQQDDRAINCFGTYGSGKSRLAVLIGQILRDGISDREFGTFLNRLIGVGEGELAKKLKGTFLPPQDDDARPYLVVPIYGNQGTSLQGALIEALYKAVRDSGTLDANEVLLPSEYAIAAKRLDEILQNAPQLVDSFLPGMGLGNQYHNLDQLRTGLEHHESLALSVFSNWHRVVLLGTHFSAVQHGASLAKEIYANAALKIGSTKFKGIAVIWDEFGYALEAVLTNPARSPISEIFELQEFVEKVCAPAHAQVLFLGLTHVSLSEYGPRANVADALKQRLDTISGRFSSLRVELRPAETEGYHLLAAQLVPTTQGREIKTSSKSRAERVASACKNIGVLGRLGDGLINIVEGCYPLHPLASAALLALSARYAAATRTAFTFFSEMEAQRMFDAAVIPETMYGPELIRLPTLLGYYEERMRKEGVGDHLDTFKSACAQIDGGNPTINELNERRDILSIIMLASVLDSGFQAGEEYLAIALHDAGHSSSEAEPLRKALAWLGQAGLIWKNETTGQWRIGGDGGTDVDALIIGAVERIPTMPFSEYVSRFPDIAADVLPILGKHQCDPSPKGIVRSYEVMPLAKAPASSPIVKEALSSQVFIVICDSAQDIKSIERAVLSLPVDNNFYWFEHEGMEGLKAHFRRLLALTNLLEQTHSDGVRTKLSSKYESTRHTLVEDLSSRFGRKGLNKKTTKVLKQGSPDELVVSSWTDFRIKLQQAIDNSYSSELSVRAPQKRRNVLGDEAQADSAETIEIVTRILEFDEHPIFQTDLLGYPEGSEPAAVVDGVLGVNELFVRRANGAWGLRKVTELEGTVKDLVELIRSELLRRRATAYRLTELGRKLSLPPYGIPLGAAPIFAAFALQGDIRRIVWSSNSTVHAKNLCAGFVDARIGMRVGDFTQNQLNIAEVLEHSLRKAIYPGTEIEISGNKQEKARRSIELLRQHLTSISAATLDSAKIDKRLKLLYETVQEIGVTQHTILDEIGNLIDPNKLLIGAEPLYEAKAKARDKLVEILMSFEVIENALRHDALSKIRKLLPGIDEPERAAQFISQMKLSGALGAKIAEALSDTQSDVHIHETVLQVVLSKAFSHCTELEVGVGLGRVEGLLDLDTGKSGEQGPGDSSTSVGIGNTTGTAPANGEFEQKLNALISQAQDEDSISPRDMCVYLQRIIVMLRGKDIN